MPIKLSEAAFGQLLEKDHEKALNIGNRYSFINANLFPLLSREEQDMVSGFQEVNKQLLPEVNQHIDDVYPIFPKLGEHGMIQRMNPYKGWSGSTKHQMLLGFCNVGMSPEVDMAITASGILVGNSLFHNPKRSDLQERALQEIYAGTKVGGIGITEVGNGSDAVNMKLKATVNPDNSFVYNGVKIYTTNGAVADYFTTYGVTDISEPRRTMMLGLFERGAEGLKTERIAIPAARGVGIAKVTYDNVKGTADQMVAPPGEGYKRLFRGLTPERISIIGDSLGGVWNAIAHGIIYAQVRYQFGKSIFKYQGVSNVLADLYSRAAAYTAFAFQIADFYDRKVAAKIHHGEKPDPMDEGTVAIMAAQGKYLTAYFAHETAYEVVQLMGGRGAISEDGSMNGISRGENLSRISEVVGGHRNIQLMIVEAGLKATTAMSIGRFTDKAKREQRKMDEEIMGVTVANAEKLLAEDGKFLDEGTKKELEGILAKLKAASEAKNAIEAEAYARALPRALAKAGKEAYQKKKGSA